MKIVSAWKKISKGKDFCSNKDEEPCSLLLTHRDNISYVYGIIYYGIFNHKEAKMFTQN